MLELRRLAPTAELAGVVLGLAVGNVIVRRIRQCFERGVAVGLGRGELLFGLSQLLLDLLQLLDLLGRRLALQLQASAAPLRASAAR